jgi:Cu-Zn family superoxide dismutase
MKTISSRALVAVAGLTVAGGAATIATQAAANDGAIHATATIEGPGGISGFATFTEDAGGVVHVNVKVSGLAPGLHGAHIHAIGSCTPDANGVPFGGAGAHFNPHLALHGEHTRGEHAEHHAGDLPNLVVNDDGRGRLNTASAHFTLTDLATESLFDTNGSAIVIHANQDDYVTQTGPLGPGQSGPRIACGRIVEGLT